MKRQRGRNNRRPNNSHNNSNNPNRSFDSNGPDVKVRGNAKTIFEKYTTLARDAVSSGHRVKAENYLQHAEHYLRVMNEQLAKQKATQEQREAEQEARKERENEKRARQEEQARAKAEAEAKSKSKDVVEDTAADATAPQNTDETPTANPKRTHSRRKPKPGTADDVSSSDAAENDAPKVERKPRRKKVEVLVDIKPNASVDAAE